MCGRFSLTCTLESVKSHFNLKQGFYMSPRFNIAPNQKILVQVRPGTVDFFEWGLKVTWLTESSQIKPFINARAETILEKPLFRQAIRKRRCLVIADGFYEWKATGRIKQPYYFHRKDKAVFAMAGIFENETVAIITAPANHLVSAVHTRMPVLLPEKYYADWLGSTADEQQIVSMLQVPSSGDLLMYPVSNAVNRPEFDNMLCIHSLQT